jgi:hypothetical protein
MTASRLFARSTALATFLTLASGATAQSFNIDVGSAPAPATTFGAGASQAGEWNVFVVPPTVNAPMNDITGAATPVTMTVSGGFLITSVTNLVGAAPDDIALMTDVLDPSTTATWTISNLAAGEYDIYTYAMAPDSAAYLTRVDVLGSIDPFQDVGGTWPNAYVLGITHSKHHITVAPAATITITTVESPMPPGPATNFGSIGGFQIVQNLPTNGAAFCAGDGSLVDHTTPCPCGNNGAAGNGCGHSFDANGANISASGTIALDDIVLHSQFEPVSSFTLFMQHANAGDTVFHDGVLCAGNPLIRLRGRAAVAGEAFFPNSNFANDSTTTLSARGGTFPGSGATMRYAAWYRNASSTFCPPATANVTNGWVLTW